MKNNKKFSNKQYTISGEKRAYVNFNGLKTLWFNTGTLCNLSCKDCYIESSPRNDRLLYLSYEDVCKYINEIETSNINCKSIGITGGEPFMNKDIIKIISTCLNKDRELLILTNAMQPLQNKKCMLLNFQENKNLKFRISLDHYTKEKHEKIRGKNSWDKTINGVIWLHNNNFNISIASRSLYENEKLLRKGYKNLFEQLNLNLDACNNNDLVLFPEMNNLTDTPEITTACWSLLGVNPNNLMCSNSRMIVKRKENNKTHVVACTLLPYTKEYDYGEDLNNSFKTTYLNHPHCSKFCVLGGANCINN